MTETEIILIAGAYLLGSMSTAIIVCKMMRLPDPRSQGSHNPGATNVLRLYGKKPAAITLVGDMLKGVIPVLLAHIFNVSALALALVGLMAFLGHLYPLFFGLRGGKGVATMLGVLLGYHWAVGLATAATWLVIAKVFKISSVSALIATLLAPFYVYLFVGDGIELIATTAGMTAILYWRHRSNIFNLLNGKEQKIGTDAD